MPSLVSTHGKVCIFHDYVHVNLREASSGKEGHPVECCTVMDRRLFELLLAATSAVINPSRPGKAWSVMSSSHVQMERVKRQMCHRKFHSVVIQRSRSKPDSHGFPLKGTAHSRSRSETARRWAAWATKTMTVPWQGCAKRPSKEPRRTKQCSFEDVWSIRVEYTL